MSTKPRTEVPPIKKKRTQTFVLTHEELAQAAAEFVICKRSNCEWNFNDDYVIHSAHTELRITLTHPPETKK